jgi:hypothetical protein
VVFATALLIFFKNDLPPQIPFWFSRNWGAERLSDPRFLWLLPILGLVFLVTNQIIARVFLIKKLVLTRILTWTSLFIGLILLFSAYRIILISS